MMLRLVNYLEHIRNIYDDDDDENDHRSSYISCCTQRCKRPYSSMNCEMTSAVAHANLLTRDRRDVRQSDCSANDILPAADHRR